MRPEPRYWLLVCAVGAGLLAVFWDETNPILRAALVVALILIGALSSRANAPSPKEATQQTDVLEAIVANETRRPWSPTTLPWLPTGSSTRPILLVPAADYHLAEIVPLAHELNRSGIPTRIAIGASPWQRTEAALAWYPDIEVFELPEPDTLDQQVSAVLVMKDTGSLQPLVAGCRRLGIPALGKVEGAQDFWDSDTPEPRAPYRNLDLVLCQGSFDSEALGDRDTVVVGSSRLERLWWAPALTAREPLALINLNFVYGVGTADRRLWLESAIQGCEAAGVPYLISLHPAERATITSNRATSISASRLLPRSTVLISRFSTVPFEAMARGVPFVYHNPHGETVKTFAESMNSFDVTRSAGELAAALAKIESGVDSRRRAEPFFSRHIDVDRGRLSERRAADAIASHLGL